MQKQLRIIAAIGHYTFDCCESRECVTADIADCIYSGAYEAFKQNAVFGGR